jgi:hypothetical protein
VHANTYKGQRLNALLLHSLQLLVATTALTATPQAPAAACHLLLSRPKARNLGMLLLPMLLLLLP